MICIAGGGGVLVEAREITIGSLVGPGPGFYPAILGALLALVGLLILGTALTAPAADDAGEELAGPDWRGCACIVGGVVAFMVIARAAGLTPAIFACVLVSALGDRTTSLRGSLVLALVMSAAGTVLFGYLLGINMALWRWPWAP